MAQEKSSELFTCELCFERLTVEGTKRPLALPCLHSFCADCLSQLPTLKCPTCRMIFPSRANLLPNYALISQIGMHRDVSDLSTAELEEMLKKRKIEEAQIRELEAVQAAASMRLEAAQEQVAASTAALDNTRAILEARQAAVEARIIAAAEAIRQEEQPALQILAANTSTARAAAAWPLARVAAEQALLRLLALQMKGGKAPSPAADAASKPIGKKLFAHKNLQQYLLATIEKVSHRIRFIREFNGPAGDDCFHRAVYVGLLDNLVASICLQNTKVEDEEDDDEDEDEDDSWDEEEEAACRARLSSFCAALASSDGARCHPHFQSIPIDQELQKFCTEFLSNPITMKVSNALQKLSACQPTFDIILDLALRWLALESEAAELAPEAAVHADDSPAAVMARAISRTLSACNPPIDVDIRLWRIDESTPECLRCTSRSRPVGDGEGRQEVNLLLKHGKFCLMYPEPSVWSRS